MKQMAVGLLISLALLAAPLAAEAQPAGKLYRVALIFTTSPVAEMAGPEPVHPAARAFVHGLRDLTSAFSRIGRDRLDALFVSAYAPTFAHRTLIVALATRSRLPSTHAYREAVELGGLTGG